jgi:DNA-binding transcriptional regulator YiaG
MGITQRTLQVVFEHSKERFSPRKVIPVNPKTLGDHLLLKRIEADLSQPEMAVKLKVSVWKVKAWEHDQIIPTADEWRALESILNLDSEFPKCYNRSPESCDGFYTV